MTAYQTPPCEDCGSATTWAHHSPAAVMGRRHCAPCAQRHRLTSQADVDELNVELLTAGYRGYRMRATRAEYTEATRVLTRRKLSANDIAIRLGVSQRSIERYRSAMRAA